MMKTHLQIHQNMPKLVNFGAIFRLHFCGLLCVYYSRSLFVPLVVSIVVGSIVVGSVDHWCQK